MSLVLDGVEWLYKSVEKEVVDAFKPSCKFGVQSKLALKRKIAPSVNLCKGCVQIHKPICLAESL